MGAFTLTGEQQDYLDATTPDSPGIVCQAGAGAGKALRIDQPVVTPSGYLPIGDLAVGDAVMGRDGNTYEVSGIFPQGTRALFDVRFSDGTSVIADADHRWKVHSNKQRDRGSGTPGWALTTAEILERGVTRPGGGGRWFVPMPEPLALPEADLPIDPWLLGALLGDGTLAVDKVEFTTVDDLLLDRVAELIRPMGLVPQLNAAGGITYRLSGGRKWQPGFGRTDRNPLLQGLRALGLGGHRSHEKFVPAGYRTASARQRLELLRGLFDTDGSRCRPGAVEFTTVSADLADDVQWLVHSLGGTATRAVKTTTARDAYRLYVKLPASIVPFWLPRKAVDWKIGTRIRPYRAIRSITPVEPAEAVCISVTSPDHLFLTAGCVPTHNTTVTKVAAEKLHQHGLRGIYTAFNSAIVTAARGKFPSSVSAATTYSMAWHAGGKRYKPTMDIKGQRLADKARILGINDPLHLGKDVAPLSPPKVARLVLGTVTRFCGSADETITAAHVPGVPGAEEFAAGIADTVLPFARRAWKDMGDPTGKHGGGRLATTHALYFKRWALTHPQVQADYLIVDECQDTDPVLAAVLREQQIPLYLIGDDAQMIFAWRECESIMGDFPNLHQLTLTRSFRFGPAVADEANKWLDLLDAKIRIAGHDPVRSTVGDVATPDAVLTRSNAGAVAEAIRAHAEGVKVHLKGAGDDVLALAEGAEQLMQGRQAWHPELQAFTSWGQVEQYVQDGTASAELENTVRLLDTHGIATVQEALRQTVPEAYAERVVTTTHKVKGLEWDAVRIGDDWRPPRRGEDPTPETSMLAYVAVTRAKRALDRGGLYWVDDYAGTPFAAADAAAKPELAEPVRECVEVTGSAAAAVPVVERVAASTGVARGAAVLRGWLDDHVTSDEELEGVVRDVVAAYLDQGVRPVLRVVGG